MDPHAPQDDPKTETAAERRARVDALLRRGSAARRDNAAALGTLAEDAYELACQTDANGEQYVVGMAGALSLMARKSLLTDHADVALSQASQALGLLASEPKSAVLGDVYETMGWAHYYLGEHVEALDDMARALEIGEDLGDQSIQAYALDRIACIHHSAGHLDVSREAHERALAMQRELGDEFGIALTQNNMAYTYMDLGEYDKALDAVGASRRWCETTRNAYLLAGTYDTTSETYLRLGDVERAKEFSNAGLSLALELGLDADEADSRLALARIALRQNDLDEALWQAEQSRQISARLHRLVEDAACHELLSRIYERRGDLLKALDHFRQFHMLRQEKLDEDTSARLASMRIEQQVQLARKDAEIHRLRTLALEREVEEGRIAQARLEAQSSLDPLTGLFNRRHMPVLEDALAACRERQRPASLIMLDIDDFKLVNDTYGHQTGDQVLVAIAQEISTNARETDAPCRFGGDEFLVLLPGMEVHAARYVAERMRDAVGAMAIAAGYDRVCVTVSAGVAGTSGDSDTALAELVSRADDAMYRAKRTGKNRVMLDADATTGN